MGTASDDDIHHARRHCFVLLYSGLGASTGIDHCARCDNTPATALIGCGAWPIQLAAVELFRQSVHPAAVAALPVCWTMRILGDACALPGAACLRAVYLRRSTHQLAFQPSVVFRAQRPWPPRQPQRFDSWTATDDAPCDSSSDRTAFCVPLRVLTVRVQRTLSL